MVGMSDPTDLLSDILPRAFIDSSSMMAACLSMTGAAYDLLEAGQHGQVVSIVSQHVLLETERNLYRKAPHGLREFWERRDRLELIDPSPELVDEVTQHIEPKDAPIVAAAIAAHSDYLVTYDRRHLLSDAALIRQLYRIETVEPAVVLSRLS
jgi:predicted nucleic acid-binding protein